MRRLIWTITPLFLLCLLLPSGLFATDALQAPAKPEQDSPDRLQDQQEPSQVQLTLEKYQKDGYEVRVGPIQYLGKQGKHIELYNHQPVSYGVIYMVDEAGNACTLKKYDFVYVLQKDASVVLIRLERGERDDV